MTARACGSRWLAALAGAAMLSGCVAEPVRPVSFHPMAPDRLVGIPAPDAVGRLHLLTARVCRPRGEPPFPVAVINHGSPPDGADIAAMAPPPCDAPLLRWFTRRGYLAVAALRRGYGASEGPVAEGSGRCADPDYVRAGEEGARDVGAVVRYAQAMPDARASGTVVLGQSTGGWATVAYAAEPDPGVAALISLAGGRGGRADGRPDTYCAPERLIAAAATFGARARLPMLWIVARNDGSFSPAIEAAMRDAFDRAGGQAVLAVTPAFGEDGHLMFGRDGGEALWGPPLARYLAERAPGGGQS